MYLKQMICTLRLPTNYIILGNRKVHSDLNIKIHNDKIIMVSETKFLGVWIDNKIIRKPVECVKGNLSRVVGIIYRARHILVLKIY